MGKGTRALFESVEPRQLLASVSGLVWSDLNGDKAKQTREKWFAPDGLNAATITLYADFNGNGRFDSGLEPSDTLNKEGTYSIEIDRTGPVAVRTSYTINTNTQTATAVFGMVPVVVVTDLGQTLNNVNVPLQKGAIVTGTFYTDENANETLDTGEVKRGKALVFFDENEDGVRQNEEPFTPLDAPAGSTDFKYTIPVPVGEGSLRVVRVFETDTLTIAPVTFTATAGQKITGDFRIVPEMVLQGRLFSDTNGNGKRNKGEAYVGKGDVRAWFDFNNNNVWDKDTEPTASTDVNGNYRLVNRKTSSLFGAVVRFRTSATNVVASTLGLERIIFKTIQETQTYNFGFKAPSIKVNVINDADSSKTITSGDSNVQYVVVYIDANNNNKQDTSEASAITDATGIATFSNLTAGNAYKVVVKFSSKWKKTSDSNVFNVTLAPFEAKSLLFGMKRA